jgi:4-amino-4-deoxy-L-arabinose transferase-like glycosyltransferase
MLALLFPLEGFLLYKIWRCMFSNRDWREAILATYVTMGVLITLSTEALGIFHAITGTAIQSFWGSIIIITLFLFFKVRTRKILNPFSFKMNTRFEWGILFTISIYFFITLIIALIAPPNTNDSLQYHMSRVMHWIVNHSVDFYATSIDRQLWMPPFAEYSILHLYLLAGNDWFVNLVQWFSMAGSVVAVTLIAGQIGVKPRGQWFAALFTLTLPIGILQSTSTQTDYAAAFWTMCVFYYILLESQQILFNKKAGFSINSILIGLSFSLGVLTKGTVYAIVFPLFVYFLIVLIQKHLWKVITGMVLLGSMCTFTLNGPIWLRNYSIYRSILGPGVDFLGSSNYDPRLIFSTALKNATNQLALPVGPGNKALYLVLVKFHDIIGLDINDPRITSDEFRIRFSRNEDIAGNPGHFLFWIFSSVFISILIIQKRSLFLHKQTKVKSIHVINKHPLQMDRVFSYVLILIAGFFLFALFKWQSVNTRLLLPWLIAIGPMAGWVSDAIQRRMLLVILTASFSIIGLPYLVANPSRPLFRVGENESILLASRTEVQFYNSPEIRDDLISVVMAAKDYDCGSIGLELDSNTSEYLIWYLLVKSKQPIYRMENLITTSETRHLIDPSFRPCLVFCNICTISKEKGYQLLYNRGSFTVYYDQQ